MKNHSDSALAKAGPSPILSALMLVLLAAIVVLLGGSSRNDMAQLAALYPLCFLALIPAIYWFRADAIARGKVPFAILLCFIVWMLIQLVPLPPELWRSLPGREPIAALDTLLGMDDVWRPISLAPTLGWGALMSMVVPAAGLLFALLFARSSKILLTILAATGVLNALLGIMQTASGAGVLFFYRIHNAGKPVGFFANENHSIAFAALAMVTIAYLSTKEFADKRRAWLSLLGAAAFILVFIVSLTSGSRAGILLSFLSFFVSSIIVWLGMKPSRSKRKKVHSKQAPRRIAVPTLILSLAGFAALAAAGLLYVDSPALNQLADVDPTDELRVKLLPVLQEMAALFWLLGVGYSGFKDAYHQFEPTELLLSNYVNNAHNDWLQFVIEGGLPALLLMGWLFAFLALRMIRFVRAKGFFNSDILFWLTALAVFALASIVDYPLRTPIFQLFGVWLFVSIAIETGKVVGEGEFGGASSMLEQEFRRSAVSD